MLRTVKILSTDGGSLDVLGADLTAITVPSNYGRIWTIG